MQNSTSSAKRGEMDTVRGPGPRRDQVAESFRVTPLLVRFDDDGRERQFKAQQLALQVRTVLLNAVVVTAVAAVQWPLRILVDAEPMHARDAVALVASFVLGAVLVGAMAVGWTAQWHMGSLVAASLLLPAILAVVLISGAPIDAQGFVIVAGGVIVAYYSSRLDFLWTTFAAATYSAITIPVWLLHGPTAERAELAYTLATVVAVHIAGMMVARRTHRELRVLSAQREDLRELSAIDVLTGLANRRAFDQHMDQVWATWQTSGRTPSVLMLDIDHFKELNDSLGHAAGDLALKKVSEAIRSSLRQGSGHMVARYGGEEFVILLPDEPHNVVHSIGERIGSTVRHAGIEHAVQSRDAHHRNPRRPLTISIGMATARVTMTSPNDLVRAADRALYRAKADGRDCVRCAEEDLPAGLGLSGPGHADASAGDASSVASASPVTG